MDVVTAVSSCSSLNNVFTDSGNTEDQENEDPQDAEGQTSQLWVERFSPRHYTELLSDDVSAPISFCVWSSLLGIQGLMLRFALSFQFTNRCLLKWLKLWDNVVFGRERKSRPVRSDRQSANQNSFKLSQGSQNPNRFKSKMEMTEEILEAELDQYKRPKYRVDTQQLHHRHGFHHVNLEHNAFVYPSRWRYCLDLPV